MDKSRTIFEESTGFCKKLKGARTAEIDGATEGVTRYYKNGKYIDMTSDGTIVSFGTVNHGRGD